MLLLETKDTPLLFVFKIGLAKCILGNAIGFGTHINFFT
jgi:hypothetical protein